MLSINNQSFWFYFKEDLVWYHPGFFLPICLTKKSQGAECFEVVGENRADQILAKKAVKDKANLANVTRSVKQLSLAERTVARAFLAAKQLSLAEPTAAKGGKFSRTNESSRAQQVRGESERKDKTNLANVTRSAKQLSLAEPTAAKGGKFSRINESSRAQQVRGGSERKRSQVCLSMPDVPKSEKIKLRKANRERVLACAIAEACEPEGVKGEYYVGNGLSIIWF